VISGEARKIFIGLLAACVYSWLVFGTTTDVALILNTRELAPADRQHAYPDRRLLRSRRRGARRGLLLFPLLPLPS
jgi:hypothetical protein